MATRYWVGGAGTWNTSSTANWSASSGGPSGASAPTSSDDVIFDQAGTYTVTLVASVYCNNFTVSAGTVTFSGIGSIIYIYGSLSITANTIVSVTVISFLGNATGRTITTNGVSFNSVQIAGIGCDITLNTALTTNLLTLSAGTLNTNGFTISTQSITISGVNTKVFNISTSTITLTASTPISATVGSSNFTTTGTGKLYCTTTTASVYIEGGGYTYPYTIEFSYNGSTSVYLNNINTVGNLTFASLVNALGRYFYFNSNTVITNTFTAPTSFVYTRQIMMSDVFGTSRTISIGAFSGSTTDLDFRDITLSGTNGSTITRVGDCGGNSNVATTPPKTVYYYSSNDSWTNSWAMSPTGATSTNNYPLAQDTAIFTNNSTATIVTTPAYPIYSTIDMSARTNAMTFYINASMNIYGDFILGSGITVNSSGFSISFYKRNGVQLITSAGKTLDATIFVYTIGNTLRLTDNLTLSNATNTVAMANGTLDLNNKILTTGTISFNGSSSRTINFGTNSTINVIGATYNNGTTTTVSGTGTINMTSASAKSIINIGYDTTGYANITINNAGAGKLTINNGGNINCTIGTLTNSVSPATFEFYAGGTTTINNFNINGTAGNLVVLQSSTAGTRFNLSKSSGSVVGNYLNIKDSNGTGGAYYFAGFSTDSGNNLGWQFNSSTITATTLVGTLNTPDVTFTSSLNVLPNGVEGINYIGSATATTALAYTVQPVYGTTVLGETNIWGIIPTSQSPNWTEVAT